MYSGFAGNTLSCGAGSRQQRVRRGVDNRLPVLAERAHSARNRGYAGRKNVLWDRGRHSHYSLRSLELRFHRRTGHRAINGLPLPWRPHFPFSSARLRGCHFTGAAYRKCCGSRDDFTCSACPGGVRTCAWQRGQNGDYWRDARNQCRTEWSRVGTAAGVYRQQFVGECSL